MNDNNEHRGPWAPLWHLATLSFWRCLQLTRLVFWLLRFCVTYFISCTIAVAQWFA